MWSTVLVQRWKVACWCVPFKKPRNRLRQKFRQSKPRTDQCRWPEWRLGLWASRVMTWPWEEGVHACYGSGQLAISRPPLQMSTFSESLGLEDPSCWGDSNAGRFNSRFAWMVRTSTSDPAIASQMAGSVRSESQQESDLHSFNNLKRFSTKQ